MSHEDVFQVEPPRKSSGGSSKLLIGLAIGCGGMLLLCCGGFAIMGWYSQKMVEDMVSDDPVEIAQKTGEITEITIPEDFKPTFAMDLKIPIADERIMLMTSYVGEGNENNILILAEFGEQFSGENQREQMEMQMRQAMDEQGQQQGTLDLEEPEEFIHEVRGIESTFNIASGTRDGTEEIWQVSGTFEGKSGPAFVSLTVDKEKMTREEIEAFIESIK